MTNETDQDSFYKISNVPYRCIGHFINDDLSLVIHGSLKQFEKWRSLGVVLSGRFPKYDVTSISKAEADDLLKQL